MSDTSTTIPPADAADMGIGLAEPGQELTRAHHPADTEAGKDAMVAELAGMITTREEGGIPDIGAIEAESQYTDQGMRPQPAQPAQQQEPPPAHATAQDIADFGLGGGQQAESGAVQGGNDATLVPPTAEQQTQPQVDLNKLAGTLFGEQGPNENEARALIELAAKMRSLGPQEAYELQRVLNGQPLGYVQGPQYPQQPPQQQYTPPPTGVYQPQSPQLPPQAVPPQQYPPAGFDLPELDPEFAQALKPFADVLQAQHAELEAIRQAQFQQNQRTFQQQQQENAQRIDQAASQWRNSREGLIDAAEYLTLEREVINQGFLGGFIAQGVPPDQAVNQAFDYAFRSHPEFVEREIAVRTQAQRKADAEQAQRTNISTALSGGGGVAPTPQPKAAPQRNGRSRRAGELPPTAAMVDAVTQILGEGNPAN